MNETHMTEDKFIALISAYGGKPENWPLDNRAAMQAFCRTHPQAEALLGRERMLDGWLDSRLPDASETLLAQLDAQMQSALTGPQIVEGSTTITSLPTPMVSRRLMASAMGALAACFVGGFIAAPIAVDLLTGGADLMASLDIISDVFLPIEPL